MALEKCNSAISAAIGRELTEREKGQVSRKALALKQKLARAQNPDAINDVLKDFHDDIKTGNLISQRNAALNWNAFSKLKAWRQGVGPIVKNPGEVLKGLMRGSLFNFAGSKESVAALAMHESNSRTGAFLADLMQLNLKDLAFGGTLDKQIVAAQHDIRNGKVPDAAKYGKNAVDIANIFEKHQEALRTDLNGAGSWIARNADRLFRRTHDAYKIAKAGANQWGSDASKAAWSKFVNERMDWTKAFDGDYASAGDKEKTEVLHSLWTQFTADSHVKFGEDQAPVPGVGTRNFGKKNSFAREIVFKSPQADLEYQQTFGRGNSVAENVKNGLSGGGKDLAIMKKLGANPLETLNNFVEDWRKELTAANDAKGLSALDKSYQRELNNTWRILTQSAGHPNESFVGRFMSSVRHTTNTAALGMSIFSVPGDLALKASMLHHYSGEGFAKSLWQATVNQFTGMGLSKDGMFKLMTEAGIRAEGLHLPLSPDLADHVAFGTVAKYNQFVMSLTGHSQWTNRLRTNSLVADAYRHWTFKDTKFAALPDGMRMALTQFGIDAKGWEVLRKTDAETLDNNIKAFLPSNIRNAELGKFKSLVEGKSPSDYQLKAARDRLADNYRNLLGEMADRTTTSPSYANRAFMGLGTTDAGTAQGEIYRGFLQLKGFVFNYMRNHLGREIFGYSSEYKSLPQAMADMMRGQNNKGVVGLSKLIAAGVAISTLTNAMRDLATGKTPEDPTTLHSTARAFARQSFGLYSDFLLNGKDNETLYEKIGEMGGPELGLLSDMYNLGDNVAHHITSQSGMTQKNIDADSQRLFGMAYHNTPGTNLFWDKWALDYFVLNHISDQLNPGYRERLQKRVKETGQSYIAGGPSP